LGDAVYSVTPLTRKISLTFIVGLLAIEII
jgi:hypothetical protein